MILPLLYIYFSNRALTFMLASQMARLAFFRTSMSQPGIKPAAPGSILGILKKLLFILAKIDWSQLVIKRIHRRPDLFLCIVIYGFMADTALS